MNHLSYLHSEKPQKRRISSLFVNLDEQMLENKNTEMVSTGLRILIAASLQELSFLLYFLISYFFFLLFPQINIGHKLGDRAAVLAA